MFYQVAGQGLLLLYSITDTKTSGGLETVFKQNTFMGFNMDPIIVLGLSIAITFKSCITLNHKAVRIEKHYVPFKSSCIILLWGLFSSMRRILSMIVFFVPSLGLFNILNHYRAELLPYTVWKRFRKTQQDKIALYGLNETILWGDLDRWDYSTDSVKGTPPPYSEYTGLSLKGTFCLFFVITALQFLVILVVKILTSTKFYMRGDLLDKFLHLVQSLNLAFPFEDWDQGKFSVQEYRKRHRQTNIEMSWSMFVNIVFSVILMIPLLYTGIKSYEINYFNDIVSSF